MSVPSDPTGSALRLARPQQTHRGLSTWGTALTRTLLPLALIVVLATATILPIGALLMRAFLDRKGGFVGAANFVRYVTEPGLSIAAWNSL